MKIRNFDQLASSPLRRQALEIINAGFEAISTDQAIRRSVRVFNNQLMIKEKIYNLGNFEKVYLIAIGKCALAASKTLEDILGDRLSSGFCLDIRQEKLDKVESVLGTHPLPSQENVEATKKILAFLDKASDRDLVITVVSGGGSALLSAPYKIDFQTKALISNELMKAGADITELNIVRKHLSDVKGGRFAQIAHPATVVSLIFSDVPGNDLSTIASGITVMDATTVDDARKILEKYDILQRSNLLNLELTESPKDPQLFKKVANIIMLDANTVVQAMKVKAMAAGFTPRIVGVDLRGEASEVGNKLISDCQSGEALLAAGETTVHVSGNGIGGRNQTLVMSNLKNIKKGQVLISVGSDGHDHSNYAGAVGDENSSEKARSKNLDVDQYLRNSDSFNFFTTLGDGIDTGLLDSNVSDFMLVLQSFDKR